MSIQVERRKLVGLLCHRITRTGFQVIASSPNPARAIEDEVVHALKEFEAILEEAGVNSTGIYIAKRLFAQKIVYMNLIGMFEGREVALATETLTMDLVDDIFKKLQPVERGHLRLVQ